MAVQVTSEQGRYSIAIDGEMTIRQAAEVMPQLLMPLADGSEVEVNLSGVCEVDSAGLQLLILAKKEAIARGVSMRFVGHSQAVVDVLDLCQLAGHFGDPVVLPSAQNRSDEE